MDERARQILEQAWANVERIEKMVVREPAITPVEQWTPPVRERRQELDTMPHNPAADKAEFDRLWNEWFDGRIATALNNFGAEYSDAMVEVVFTRMDKHKRELEAELAKLRAELNLLREVRSGGNVMELRKPDVA